MNITKYRFDLVFSYWIFTWFLLYYFKIIQYSPKLALCISIIENAILFCVMLFILQTSWMVLVKFLLINTVIKIIPIYLVWKDKINWTQDIIKILSLFFVYAIWVYLNMKSENILEIINTIVNYRPGIQLLNLLIKN
jgi:hypothetical protein